MTVTWTGPAVLVEGLHKSFGDVHALRGVDFAVPAGTVLGMLGPNGAGKTTAVKILTTLLRPDAGSAKVEGHDVMRDADAVRHRIGLAGQSAAIQEELTGRENLEIMARLYHLGPRLCPPARDGTAHAVRPGRRGRPAGQDVLRRHAAQAGSGGEPGRVPSVLFLDEPTTGLDPRSRLGMWAIIRELVAGGTTLLLTTQYLDEADALADEIVVIDHG